MKKFIKFLAATLSVIVMSLSAVGCSACNSDIALEDGTLTVGYTIYAPMNYFDAEENFVGFDTELAKEVGKLLGVEVEFVEINWDNKVMSLNGKEIDAIWNGMTITDELSQATSITDPYLDNRQVIVCQQSVAANYTTQQSLLNAAEILVEAGSAGENAAKSVAGIDQSKIRTASAQKDTLLEVLTSSSKVAIIDSNMAKVLTGAGTSYSSLTYVNVDFPLEQFGIAFRKDDVSSRDAVNSAINTLKTNGVYNTLFNKYFG